MKLKKYQRGYYASYDPLGDILFLFAAIGIIVVVAIAALIIDENAQELSPGVYEVTEVACVSVTPEGEEKNTVCNIRIEPSDEFGVDEVTATKYVLMLEEGEEYAETIDLVEVTEVDFDEDVDMEEALEGLEGQP